MSTVKSSLDSVMKLKHILMMLYRENGNRIIIMK